MLNQRIQEALAKRYGSSDNMEMIKKAFDHRQTRALQEDFAEEREEYAVVSFTDVASFSSTVEGWSATEVREFLDDYYAIAIPEIYRNGGVIDRIAGDGILAVYSNFFDSSVTPTVAQLRALAAAEATIYALHGTERAAKVAISDGPLLFCKTGLAEVYEDYTIIGEPITVAYRIEDVAEINYVLLRNDTALAGYIWNQVADSKARQQRLPHGPMQTHHWFVDKVPEILKGIGKVELLRQRYDGLM